jgi:hypothetical protein
MIEICDIPLVNLLCIIFGFRKNDPFQPANLWNQSSCGGGVLCTALGGMEGVVRNITGSQQPW